MMQWTMKARARCGETSTVVVKVRQSSVWLSVVPFHQSEAILDPEHIDKLVRTLVQAGQAARATADQSQYRADACERVIGHNVPPQSSLEP